MITLHELGGVEYHININHIAYFRQSSISDEYSIIVLAYATEYKLLKVKEAVQQIEDLIEQEKRKDVMIIKEQHFD